MITSYRQHRLGPLRATQRVRGAPPAVLVDGDMLRRKESGSPRPVASADAREREPAQAAHS
ncbi:hypothetical protein AB0H42_10020 [Nocardia sp. NPDC050799]|uniref:hypothetical protein n=1 Tax=Nocardia sp. NPDC050799 TaxID=3154842 RepID=UPI0033C6F709